MTSNRNNYPFHARHVIDADARLRMLAAIARHDKRKAHNAMVNRVCRLACFACVVFSMIAFFYGVTN